MTNNIKVLLLAAGKSTRFWPLSDKNLLPFFGKPLITRQIEKIQKVGFKEIYLIVNKENFNETKKYCDNCIIQNGEGLGAAVISGLESMEGPVIIVNSDDIFPNELLENAKKFITGKNPKNFLTATRVEKYFPGGYLKLVGNKIKEIIEKPGEDKMPSQYFKFVLDYFSDCKNIKEELNKLESKQDYELALNHLMKNGESFDLLEFAGKWASLKYPWHVLDAARIFLEEINGQQIDKSGAIDKTAIITGPVIIESNVKIFEHAKIVGPCYIGKNVIIGNNAIVRESVIEEGSVLGFTTDVARSYIGKNCWFHSNYIGDSILEENVGMGAGANLANLRLDEDIIFSFVKGEKINSQKVKLGSVIGKNVRIGINASIMPGVKIGKNTFIGGGITVDKDIEDSLFCYGETKLITKPNSKKLSANRDQFKNKI